MRPSKPNSYYDARLNCVMPTPLYEAALAQSNAEFRSLNSFVRSALAEKLERVGRPVCSDVMAHEPDPSS